MKIAQVITQGDTFYGAQRHVLDLCRLLHEDGHEVVVLVGSDGALTERFDTIGIPFRIVQSLQRAIHPIRDLQCIRDLETQFRQLQPEIVATHSSKAGIVARLASHRAGIPNVFTVHGWSFEDGVPFVNRQIYLTLERFVARRTNHFIAVSESCRQLGIDSRVATSDKIETIHNGVEDIESHRPRQLNELFTMTMVAGFRKQKDHRTLIAALGKLKHRQWLMNFVGDGELLESMKSYSRQCGLAENVRFHGAVNNVASILQQTNLKVLTTNWEGLPISIIEALAHGMPVVATDVSGVKEEVIDGYNGLLTQRNDVDAVRYALEKMMDSNELCLQYGKNSRTLFEERFTLAAMYAKTKERYQRIIEDSST